MLQKNYKNLKSYIKDVSRYEWEVAVNNNNQRGKVYNQEELLEKFNPLYADDGGASKAVFKDDFTTIVIKRMKTDASRWYGNQVAKELRLWQYAQAHEDLCDCLTPILKWFTCKSDKVQDEDDLAYEKYIIIEQKAVFVSTFDECCNEAQKRNIDEGYRNYYNNAEDEYDEKYEILEKYGIYDWDGHPCNSGVIFDHEKNCYKAVLIDYGLNEEF